MLRSTLLILLVLACAATVAAVASAHPQDGAAVFDVDHDQVKEPPVGTDNCAGQDGAYNPSQTDIDSDGLGDACDTDDDGDNVDDALDSCPNNANAAQADADGDGTGDTCDVDDDGDGLADSRDNCRFYPNPDQADGDGDGLGDACEEGTAGGPTTQPPGFTGAADALAPQVTLGVRSAQRVAELGAGLAVPVSCSERCVVTSTLTVSARDARRLRVKRELSSGGAELDAAGDTFVFLDLPRTMLRRVRRPVRAVLRVEVADPAGNRRALTRRLTIRS